MSDLTVKVLPPERWGELAKFAQFKHIPPKPDGVVVVAEDSEGVLKAAWAAQPMMHIEPAELTEEAQDGGHTALKMLALLLTEVEARGEVLFFAFAPNETMVQYLLRLGMKPLPALPFLGVRHDLSHLI